MIDGEVVAFDEEGGPSFNALQNYGTAPGPVVSFVFDLLVLAGRDVTREPLSTRQRLLESVKAQGFEGLVAKRRDSLTRGRSS